MKKQKREDDFVFSSKQLQAQIKYHKFSNAHFRLTFINGKQFTQRGVHPVVSNWDDAVTVIANVIGASENNPEYIITYQNLDYRK
jgi:hypothetical protein